MKGGGRDYAEVQDLVEFAPGTEIASYTITILQDQVPEDSEVFSAVLETTAGGGVGEITITDAEATIIIDDTNEPENGLL